MKMALIAMVMVLFVFFTVAPGMTAFAGGDALELVMEKVLEVISSAALYVGIVICLWGAFQVIMALRREDSEGVSKQIITIVVGGVLIGFRFAIPGLYDSLKNASS
jgi:hypothetical protein